MATKKEDVKVTKTAEEKSSKPADKKVVKTTDATTAKTEDNKKTAQKTATKPQEKPVEKPAVVKKTSSKKYHIAQRSDDNMWQVKAEGAEKALKLFKTQQEAIDYAKKVADNQEGSIMIHKKDGSFRKLTY